MPTNKSSPLFYPVLLCTFALLALAACADVNHLRQAQSDFNAAAKADWEEFLKEPDPTTIEEQIPASASNALYASAIMELDQLALKKQSLQNNHLWGVALTLRSLCLWKLGRYDQALQISSEALSNDKDQLSGRDTAVLKAIPTLVAIDESWQKIYQMELGYPDGDYKDIYALLGPDCKDGRCGAISTLSTLLQNKELTPAMRIYLLQVKLVALANLERALFFADSQIGTTDCPCKHYQNTYPKLSNELTKTLNELDVAFRSKMGSSRVSPRQSWENSGKFSCYPRSNCP